MILGIDPGLENTGWAVVNENKLIECGVVKVGKGDGRLKDLDSELEKIIKKFKVTEVAFESLFFAKNAKSAMMVAEAVGVIKLAAIRCGLEVVGYTPLQVKMALTGYGRAEKEQVETMVRSCLNLEVSITPSHAADAVAVALTHGFTMKI
ncbi:MAG: crossover junction endodeoxyribonuclease RuvC [Candidatus Shapirobacteria bacterium]|nr:crossover junction endodeoxyribonuclease RuvC [Candidatus Shapirobacteria bacterium]